MELYSSRPGDQEAEPVLHRPTASPPSPDFLRTPQKMCLSGSRATDTLEVRLTSLLGGSVQ